MSVETLANDAAAEIERMRLDARAYANVHDAKVLVPREATDEMISAGRDALRAGGLLPAYTDSGKNGQLPIMAVLLKDAWASMVKVCESAAVEQRTAKEE